MEKLGFDVALMFGVEDDIREENMAADGTDYRRHYITL